MIYHGDLFDVLPTIDAESIDACVTDPPYGIGFMGREWDTFKPDVVKKTAESGFRPHPLVSENLNVNGRRRSPALSPSQIDYNRSLSGQRGFQTWTERWASQVLRVLKPGATLLVCGAPRSFHRMACGIEDAGFQIRDCLSWLYGQGFPKSLNLGEGRGTALKPSWEPIILARKPFTTSVASVLNSFGTGALNIDACRLQTVPPAEYREKLQRLRAQRAADAQSLEDVNYDLGRWPANVVLDEEAAHQLDRMAPFTGAVGAKDNLGRTHGFCDGRTSLRDDNWGEPRDERSGASRFFYVAKPSRVAQALCGATVKKRNI